MYGIHSRLPSIRVRIVLDQTTCIPTQWSFTIDLSSAVAAHNLESINTRSVTRPRTVLLLLLPNSLRLQSDQHSPAQQITQIAPSRIVHQCHGGKTESRWVQPTGAMGSCQRRTRSWKMPLGTERDREVDILQPRCSLPSEPGDLTDAGRVSTMMAISIL